MSDLDPKINELEARLESLVRTQIGFQAEISAIRNELSQLRGFSPRQKAPFQPTPPPVKPPPRPQWPESNVVREVPPPVFLPPRIEREASGTQAPVQGYFDRQTENARSNLEKFIGENLISKVGILILILGVGIGAKYAVDNNLISPLTRIIIGYAFGFGLLGLAARLKAKYLNFSAVLLSGSLAIMYFITYFAYATYELIGQTTAFPLMVVLTAFAVVCAVLYNRQVIAHVGLVGAYAVPFLLSTDSGRYAFLFTYMSVINAGILAISVRKYWRPIFYTASVFTWLIFAAWFGTKYEHAAHFLLGLTFLGIFAAIFYATKIAHGFIHPERDRVESTAAILGTGFIFYCFCAAIGDVNTGLADYTLYFSYLCVAAVIVLISSWNHYGRVMLYLAYPFSWLLFGAWFLKYYSPDQHFVLAGVFAAAFFAIFYFSGLIYKLVLDDLEDPLTTGLLLTNSFAFYGFTIAVAASREATKGTEGILTVAHAALHGVVSQIVGRLKADSALVVQTLTVLVLTFSTIAIPIQFDGNLVTIVWVVEAAALFSIGRLRSISVFEYFAYPLAILALFSLFADWIMVYYDRVPYPSELNRVALRNGDFLTALVFVAAFAVIYVVNRRQDREPPAGTETVRVIGYTAAAVALFVLYNAGRIEVSNYFHQWFASASQLIDPSSDSGFSIRDIGHVGLLAQLIYTMLFVSTMTVINLGKARSLTITFATTALTALSLFAFVTVGMVLMYELRVSYMGGSPGTSVNILIRYAVYLTTAILLTTQYFGSRDSLLIENVGRRVVHTGFEAVLTITLFLGLSFELVNLMAQFSVADGTKLGLSILWGLFALGMTAYGIAFDVKYQRIAAISLLGMTLVKLFFYDISNLGTIPKTVLFITLGTLLLIVSFLYNKYKNLIFAAAGTESPSEDEL